MHGPGRRPSRLAPLQEAGRAPQGDGYESLLAAAGVTPSSTQERSYFSGSANTHSMEPLSGYLISVASCETERRNPEPPPVDTATYCLPFTLYEIGNELTALLVRTCQSTLPVSSSNARK